MRATDLRHACMQTMAMGAHPCGCGDRHVEGRLLAEVYVRDGAELQKKDAAQPCDNDTDAEARSCLLCNHWCLESPPIASLDGLSKAARGELPDLEALVLGGLELHLRRL